VAGEYILAVAGRELTASDDIYAFFEETAGRQVLVRVGPNPDGRGAREVTVVPVESEENRAGRPIKATPQGRRADRRPRSRLPPNTPAPATAISIATTSRRSGSKPRSSTSVNEGGQLANYIVDQLHRPLMSRSLRAGRTGRVLRIDLAEGDDHQRNGDRAGRSLHFRKNNGLPSASALEAWSESVAIRT
jgi:tricorn protease